MRITAAVLTVLLSLTRVRSYSDDDFEQVLNSVVDGKLNTDFYDSPNNDDKITSPLQPFYLKTRVPQPVQIPVDRPYPIYDVQPYPVYLHRKVPYIVEKKVPIPRKRIIERPYPVLVPLEKPVYYPVQRPIPVPIKVPFERLIPVPIVKPMPVPVQKPVPYPVEKIIPYRHNVPVDVHVREAFPLSEHRFESIESMYDKYRVKGGDGETRVDHQFASFVNPSPSTVWPHRQQSETASGERLSLFDNQSESGHQQHYEVREFENEASDRSYSTADDRTTSKSENRQMDSDRLQKYFDKEHLLNLKLIASNFRTPFYDFFPNPRLVKNFNRNGGNYAPHYSRKNPLFYNRRRFDPYLWK